jgi:hypothetical protein
MSAKQAAARYCRTRVTQSVRTRVTQRVGRSLPWIGGAIALLTLGAAIRNKGVIGGTVDTALNAVPFVGGVKTLTEAVVGRDLIRSRPVARKA